MTIMIPDGSGIEKAYDFVFRRLKNNLYGCDFAWIEDPGHAWLMVNRDLVTSLNFVPTRYSFCTYDAETKTGWVFLEEDLDFGMFVDILYPDLSDEDQQKAMRKRTLRFCHPVDQSFVRMLLDFPADVVRDTLTKRGVAFTESTLDAATHIFRRRKERGLTLVG